MMHSKGTQMTDRSNANQPLPLSQDASMFDSGSWVGRVWLADQGPAVVLVKAGAVYDISTHVATVSALLEVADPVAYLRALPLAPAPLSRSGTCFATLDQTLEMHG